MELQLHCYLFRRRIVDARVFDKPGARLKFLEEDR
jgi:hypothetical protein